MYNITTPPKEDHQLKPHAQKIWWSLNTWFSRYVGGETLCETDRHAIQTYFTLSQEWNKNCTIFVQTRNAWQSL